MNRLVPILRTHMCSSHALRSHEYARAYIPCAVHDRNCGVCTLGLGCGAHSSRSASTLWARMSRHWHDLLMMSLLLWFAQTAAIPLPPLRCEAARWRQHDSLCGVVGQRRVEVEPKVVMSFILCECATSHTHATAR